MDCWWNAAIENQGRLVYVNLFLLLTILLKLLTVSTGLAKKRLSM